jgi:hypothetical protein
LLIGLTLIPPNLTTGGIYRAQLKRLKLRTTHMSLAGVFGYRR